jgi:hypothetical protein
MTKFNNGGVNMNYVLVTVFGGIISEVFFYASLVRAIQAVAEHVRIMNPERDDAAVYAPEGMISNAKDFLNNNDQYVNNVKEIIAKMDKRDKSEQ